MQWPPFVNGDNVHPLIASLLPLTVCITSFVSTATSVKLTAVDRHLTLGISMMGDLHI